MVHQVSGEEKKVLILAPEDESLAFFNRFFDRTGVTGRRVNSGQQCLEAAARESFSLIMVRIPVADLSVSALATGLAQRFSLNGDTPLLLLAAGRQFEAAREYRTARIRVVDIDSPLTNIERLVTEALGVAPRTTARLDIEMEVEAGESAEHLRCRTRDISRSGMLLESCDELPIGTEFVFNFTLPERFTPIHGRARVVRHASEQEPIASGMGVRFIAFPEGAEDAIQAFVDQNRLYAP